MLTLTCKVMLCAASILALAFPFQLMSAPKFDFSGRITDQDSYSMDLRDDGTVILTSSNCDPWYFTGMITNGDKVLSLAQLQNTNLSIQETSDQATFSGTYTNGSQSYVVTLTLLLDDKKNIQIKIMFQFVIVGNQIQSFLMMQLRDIILQ